MPRYAFGAADALALAGFAACGAVAVWAFVYAAFVLL